MKKGKEKIFFFFFQKCDRIENNDKKYVKIFFVLIFILIFIYDRNSNSKIDEVIILYINIYNKWSEMLYNNKWSEILFNHK